MCLDSLDFLKRLEISWPKKSLVFSLLEKFFFDGKTFFIQNSSFKTHNNQYKIIKCYFWLGRTCVGVEIRFFHFEIVLRRFSSNFWQKCSQIGSTYQKTSQNNKIYYLCFENQLKKFYVSFCREIGWKFDYYVIWTHYVIDFRGHNFRILWPKISL